MLLINFLINILARFPHCCFSLTEWMNPDHFQLWLTCTSACVCPSVYLPMLGPWLLLCASFTLHSTTCMPVCLCCYCMAAVHPNMALLLTGITTVRSASTRSRETACPWGMTHHNQQRKLPNLRVWLLAGDALSDFWALFYLNAILFYEIMWTSMNFVSLTCSLISKDQFEKKKNDMLDSEPWVLSGQ